MKRALLIAAIDPAIGGVLVFGDRGTGKSTAVRALAALLPKMRVVVGCRYGCDPGANGSGCEECQARGRSGTMQSKLAPVPVVDLPLGVTEDRVVGALDLERALSQGVKAFEPGLLARAHRGFLYIDEVNLLEDHIVDLLLDVAASGENVVEREGLSIRHPARFVLVGTGNPEEGELRPQLLDRFGLSVEVRTPDDLATRIEVVRRRDDFERDPVALSPAGSARTTRSAAASWPRGSAAARCSWRQGARTRGAALHGARHRRIARRTHADPRGARACEPRTQRRGRRRASAPRRAIGSPPPAAPRSAGRGRLHRPRRPRRRRIVRRMTHDPATAPAATRLWPPASLPSIRPRWADCVLRGRCRASRATGWLRCCEILLAGIDAVPETAIVDRRQPADRRARSRRHVAGPAARCSSAACWRTATAA